MRVASLAVHAHPGPMSLLPPGRPTSHSNILECTTPKSAWDFIRDGSRTALLDDGLGQDPEAGHRIEDHQGEHRQLAPQGASRVTQEAQRDRVCEIDGDHMPGHDERDLRVPDEPSPYDAVTRLEIGGAEEVPTPSQRVGDEGDYHLPLDEQIRVVVSHLVGDRDGYERESVGGRETPETYISPTEDTAQFHKAEIDAEEEQGQQYRPQRLGHRGKTYDLEPQRGLEQSVESHACKHHYHKRGPARRHLLRQSETDCRGAQVQFSLVGCGAGEALITVHAPSLCVVATAIAAQANVRVLHPDFRGSKPAEQSEEHRERIPPAQPGLLAEEGHAVECDQGVRQGEECDVARHVRTREDVLYPDEHEVKPHSGPDAESFGIALVELEPVPADQTFGPIEDYPPGIHERPQVSDESGKEAEAHPPRHPHESRGDVEAALQPNQAGDHHDEEERDREQAQAACEQA